MGGAIESNSNGKDNSKSQYGDLSTSLRSGRDDSVFGGVGRANARRTTTADSLREWKERKASATATADSCGMTNKNNNDKRKV